jgi:hypothetical protein
MSSTSPQAEMLGPGNAILRTRSFLEKQPAVFLPLRISRGTDYKTLPAVTTCAPSITGLFSMIQVSLSTLETVFHQHSFCCFTVTSGGSLRWTLLPTFIKAADQERLV